MTNEELLQELRDDAADRNELRQLGHYIVVNEQGQCNLPGMYLGPEGVAEIRRRMARREKMMANAKFVCSTSEAK
jgi:hypothetical protein